MIEISPIVLSLLIEAYVILLIGLISWIYFAAKKKKNDRNAALKLIEQIKHQSDARQSSTSSYLKKKYQLEGAQLSKAIKLIDKSEKRFFQKVIDIYINRDAEALGSLDADVAELIDTYKNLTPTVSAQKDDNEKSEQIELLQTANTQLTEELAITNKTMSDMIAEFGNMFGGGKDSGLKQTEVVEKLIAQHQQERLSEAEEHAEEVLDISEVDLKEDDVTSEEDIDNILNGITSSDK